LLFQRTRLLLSASSALLKKNIQYPQSDTMANRQQAYDTLPLTPLGKHVEILCKSLTFGNLGHTPRPSAVERSYIAGFRDFNQANYDTADKNLVEAVALARKEAARDPTGNNFELLGLSLGALGFVKALDAPAEALALYVEALGVWENVHGKDNAKLVFLYMDLASLAKLANDTQKSIDFCQKARELTEAASGTKGLELQGCDVYAFFFPFLYFSNFFWGGPILTVMSCVCCEQHPD